MTTKTIFKQNFVEVVKTKTYKCNASFAVDYKISGYRYLGIFFSSINIILRVYNNTI